MPAEHASAQAAHPRVLLVDDDATIREHLTGVLGRSGYRVEAVGDGAAALASIARAMPDLVILDVMMPVLDGRETLRRIRAEHDWLPVILLTQVGESFERAAALDEGADDYLNKPFDPQELLARIRAVLRRSVRGQVPLSASNVLASRGLRIDRPARRVFVRGEEKQLTPRAFALLEFLMARPDEVVSRERLLQSVWGFDAIVTSRAVDHRVAEIRRVLGPEADAIDTVAGVGYRFVHRVERG